jgi:hypothetical protein
MGAYFHIFNRNMGGRWYRFIHPHFIEISGVLFREHFTNFHNYFRIENELLS